MENQNNNKGVIALLIVIIVILATLCVLFATGTISFNSNNINNNEINQDNNENNNINDKNETINIKILSIDNVSFDKDAPNEKMFVTGKMNLSYKSSDFITTSMSGYCVGKNNEKYTIHPGSGWIKYNDTENSFSLANTITNSDVVYLDGTTKAARDINWNDVEIKSCIIEKFNALTTDSKSISIELNFKKEF